MYTKIWQAPVVHVCLMFPDVHRVQSDDCQDTSEFHQERLCLTKVYGQNSLKFSDCPRFDFLGQQAKVQ